VSSTILIFGEGPVLCARFPQACVPDRCEAVHFTGKGVVDNSLSSSAYLGCRSDAVVVWGGTSSTASVAGVLYGRPFGNHGGVLLEMPRTVLSVLTESVILM